MLQPGSRPYGPTSGYLVNANSPCTDKTFTPLRPGTDGGLLLGAYQPESTPAFDAHGDSLARRIVQPATFFGVRFSLATASTDPQTGLPVRAPTIAVDGDRVSGDLRAWGAAWNRGHFNQGSPKPDGSTPGMTALPSGTYDPATGAVALTWTSAIVGGPFNGFTGEWHLDGHVALVPGASTVPASTVGAAPSPSAQPAPDAALANTGNGSESTFVLGVLLIGIGASSMLLANWRRRPSRAGDADSFDSVPFSRRGEGTTRDPRH
jgi:hypothetical protein